eukprot:TRINITY_DN1938_c0_g1_i1.p1 TRINITY_DN1938_c0_g1~~TRINITY_DN1938_c0_g1_i1.p1  ORF type:complete len:932 (+),score=292.08 TRINITY_DN1938_c0_g1_i1:176-2971(+)
MASSSSSSSTAPNFGLLVKQSQDIPGKSGTVFTVPRSLPQLFEASRRQVEKHGSAVGITSTSKAHANALLAEKGYNVEKMTASLNKIEMKAKIQPREPLRPTDLKGFLDHRYRMVILTSIEETNTHTSECFEKYYMQSMLREWGEEKEVVLEEELDRCALNWSAAEYSGGVAPSSAAASDFAVGGRGGGGGDATPMDTGYGTPTRPFGTPSRPKTPASFGTPRTPSTPMPTMFTAKMEKFAQVIVQRNTHLLNGKADYPLVQELRRATESVDDRDISKKHVVVECWNLIEKLVKACGGQAQDVYERYQKSDPTLRQDLVGAARAFLEDQMWHHIERTLRQRQHAQVHLGGNPDPSTTIDEYLKLKNIRGDWSLVYLLVRCGKMTEAIKAARRFKATHDFAQYLEAYMREDRKLSSTDQSRLLDIEKSFPPETSSEDIQMAYRRALFLVIGRPESRRKHNARVFKTAPDFMWLKLCLIEETNTSRFQLSHLQHLLLAHGAGHFNPKGTNPLLYFQVLLLSQQFERAVSYLIRHKEYRVEGVHIAIALYKHGLLLQPEEGTEHFDVASKRLFWEPASQVDVAPSPSRVSGTSDRWGSSVRAKPSGSTSLDFTPEATPLGGKRKGMASGRPSSHAASFATTTPSRLPHSPSPASSDLSATLNMERLIKGLYAHQFQRADPELALHYLYLLHNRLKLQCYRDFVVETRAHKLLFDSDYTKMLGTPDDVQQLKMDAAYQYAQEGHYNDAIELFMSAGNYQEMLNVMNCSLEKAIASHDDTARQRLMRYTDIYNENINHIKRGWLAADTFHTLCMLVRFFWMYRAQEHDEYSAALSELMSTSLLPLDSQCDRREDLARAKNTYMEVEQVVKSQYPELLFCVMKILEYLHVHTPRSKHYVRELDAYKDIAQRLLLFATEIHSDERMVSELAAVEAKMV